MAQKWEKPLRKSSLKTKTNLKVAETARIKGQRVDRSHRLIPDKQLNKQTNKKEQ